MLFGFKKRNYRYNFGFEMNNPFNNNCCIRFPSVLYITIHAKPYFIRYIKNLKRDFYVSIFTIFNNFFLLSNTRLAIHNLILPEYTKTRLETMHCPETKFNRTCIHTTISYRKAKSTVLLIHELELQSVYPA